MKRRVFALAAVVLLSAVVGACGGSGPGPNDPTMPGDNGTPMQVTAPAADSGAAVAR